MDVITDALVEDARDGYRMILERDPAFLDSIDDEVEWHVSDTMPGGGTLRGPWAVLEFMGRVGELWDDVVTEAEEFLPSGDKLVVLGTWRGRARETGVLVEAPFAHVFQYRDGKVAYFRNYIDTAKALQSLDEAHPG